MWVQEVLEIRNGACFRRVAAWFNNVFQKPALSANKFQAFYRYMNRESHSLGQNIFDIKEFNYDTFKEWLKLIFDECGYIEHYKAMMK